MRSPAALEIGHDIAVQRAEFRNAITGWSDADLFSRALEYMNLRDRLPKAHRFYTVRIRAIRNEMIQRWSS
jgi:hypothetical protein